MQGGFIQAVRFGKLRQVLTTPFAKKPDVSGLPPLKKPRKATGQDSYESHGSHESSHTTWLGQYECRRHSEKNRLKPYKRVQTFVEKEVFMHSVLPKAITVFWLPIYLFHVAGLPVRYPEISFFPCC